MTIDRDDLAVAVAQLAAEAIRSSFFVSVSGGEKPYRYHLRLSYPTLDAMHQAEDWIKAFTNCERFMPMEKRSPALRPSASTSTFIDREQAAREIERTELADHMRIYIFADPKVAACPWCGNPPRVEEYDGEGVCWIMCLDPSHDQFEIVMHDLQANFPAMLERWNTRHTLTPSAPSGDGLTPEQKTASKLARRMGGEYHPGTPPTATPAGPEVAYEAWIRTIPGEFDMPHISVAFAAGYAAGQTVGQAPASADPEGDVK